MTLAEHGVYNILLDTAWEEEPTATIPADPRILAKITGIHQRIVRQFLHKYQTTFIQFGDDSKRLVNPRLRSEYEEFLQLCEKKRHAGIESGKARQAKRTGVEHVLNNSDTDLDSDSKKHHTPSVSELPLAEGFERFYAAYPKKVAKADAEKAWRQKVKPEEVPAILARVELNKHGEWKDKIANREKNFIPNPATWLRHRRWNDEILEGSRNGNHSAAAVRAAAGKYAAIPITRATA